MNITISSLDEEQQTALSQLSSKFNTPELWASAVLMGLIDEQVLRNINTKGQQLLDAAKQLPKEKRLEFTARTEQVYQEVAAS